MPTGRCVRVGARAPVRNLWALSWAPLLLLAACTTHETAPARARVAPAPQQPAVASGTKYRSHLGHFEVTFPPGRVDEGREPDGLSTVSVTSPGRSFTVAWVDLPHHTLEQHTAAQILGEVEESRRAHMTREESRTERPLAGAPSRLIVWSTTKKNVRLHSLVAVEGGRLYQVEAACTPVGADSGQLDAFVRSFRLVE
jgi:hypothetical protein